MRKKMQSLILAVLLLAIASMAFAYAEISSAEAKELMYQYCQEELGYPKEALELYNFVRSTNEGGWAFSLKVKDADPATDGLVTGRIGEDGQLARIEGPRTLSIHEQLQEAYARSERSYEAMYELKKTWELRLSQLDAQELKEFELLNSQSPLVALISHDIRLPAQGDIPYEEARKNAEAAILASPGWTQEMLEHIAVVTEVYHVPVNSGCPVYQFLYAMASEVGHRDALLANAPYNFNYDKLRKEEERVFGKVVPVRISVRIDAQTGEPVGEVYVEVPPVSSGYFINPILWE